VSEYQTLKYWPFCWRQCVENWLIAGDQSLIIELWVFLSAVTVLKRKVSWNESKTENLSYWNIYVHEWGCNRQSAVAFPIYHACRNGPMRSTCCMRFPINPDERHFIWLWLRAVNCRFRWQRAPKWSQQFWLVLKLHRPPLWSSGQSFWLQIQSSQVRSPALPDFPSSSGSGTGSTQPREVNWGATWMKKVAATGLENRD